MGNFSSNSKTADPKIVYILEPFEGRCVGCYNFTVVRTVRSERLMNVECCEQCLADEGIDFNMSVIEHPDQQTLF